MEISLPAIPDELTVVCQKTGDMFLFKKKDPEKYRADKCDKCLDREGVFRIALSDKILKTERSANRMKKYIFTCSHCRNCWTCWFNK